jgi:hypothetical protein
MDIKDGKASATFDKLPQRQTRAAEMAAAMRSQARTFTLHV